MVGLATLCLIWYFGMIFAFRVEAAGGADYGRGAETDPVGVATGLAVNAKVLIIQGRTGTWETASTTASTAASDLTIVKGRTSTWETASTDASVLKGRTGTWETASTTASTAASDLTIVKGRTSTWETASTDASVLKGRTQTWENAAATVSGGSYGMVLVFGSNVTFNGAGGYILVTNLPTSAAGLAPGRLWLGNFAAGAAVTNALCVAP
jgi:hypothetical protein